MRITKKYAGASCIGKQVFQPCEKFMLSIGTANIELQELEALEQMFLQRLGLKIAKSSAELEYLSNLENSANTSPRSASARKGQHLSGNRAFKKIMSETDIFSNAMNRQRNARSMGQFDSRRRAASFADENDEDGRNAAYSLRGNRKRSQSFADPMQFNAEAYTESDFAAGDLLLKFKKTDSSEDLMELEADSNRRVKNEGKYMAPRKSNLFADGPWAGTAGGEAGCGGGIGMANVAHFSSTLRMQLPWENANANAIAYQDKALGNAMQSTHSAHTVNGNINGNVNGNINGNVNGNINGNVNGNVNGNINGMNGNGYVHGSAGIAMNTASDSADMQADMQVDKGGPRGDDREEGGPRGDESGGVSDADADKDHDSGATSAGMYMMMLYIPLYTPFIHYFVHVCMQYACMDKGMDGYIYIYIYI
jgi:hypothetical protein